MSSAVKVVGISIGIISVSYALRRLALRNLTTSTSSSTPKKSGVYTRTGDKGSSSLYNGERRLKSDPVYEALGHQDELNCVLGIAREHCLSIPQNDILTTKLEDIQSQLFDIGAAIATPASKSSINKLQYTEFSSFFTIQLEKWIDELDDKLPPLQFFVIPSGGMACSHLNLARAVCRRTERAVVPLIENKEVHAEVGRYLNRLSDFLFVAARTAAVLDGKKEVLWKKQQPPKEEEEKKKE